MLKTKVMPKRITRLGIERHSDFAMVLYIFKHNENILQEINNNFIEILSLILRYRPAQNRGWCQKNRRVSESSDNLTSWKSYTPLNTRKIHHQKWTKTFQSYWVQSWGIIKLGIKVNVKKTDKSRNRTSFWPPAGKIHPLKQWKNITRNE